MKKIAIIIVIYFGVVGLYTTQAKAHYPWVNSDNYSPELGDSVHITLGWGHRYPLSRFLHNADVESLVMYSPDGAKVGMTAVNELEFEPENGLSKKGTYLIAAKRKTGFYTKTTEGGKRQSKKGLRNVIKCSMSQMCMKSIISVGDSDSKGDVGRKVGHPLEIIPLVSPTELSVGDYLPIQLLLHGKPYKGKIYATYMGFSTEKDVFAYVSNTDRKGRGKIRILQSGIWLLKTDYQQPYPDQDVCDVESFIATLTLEVK